MNRGPSTGDTSKKMTTTTPNIGMREVPAQLKPAMRPKKPKQKQHWKQRQRGRKGKNRQKKKNNNNNQTRYEEFETDCIIKGVTISPGSSGHMTSDFRILKKSGAAYVVAKGYKHWPGVIKILEPMEEKEWKTKHPNKSLYAKKLVIKLVGKDKSEIFKQEWDVIDCEKLEELEDNYSNKLRQKLTKQALYCKN